MILTVKQLTDLAERFDLMDDNVDHVLTFASVLGRSASERDTAVCAFCECRKTPACPWPHTALPVAPARMTFQRKDTPAEV